METKELLNAFRELDVPRLESILQHDDLSNPVLAGKFVEILRQSGAMVVKMASKKNEQRRNALRLKCKELLDAACVSQASDDFNHHIEDSGLVEHAFRTIVATISGSDIGQKSPDVQAWAVLNRAAMETGFLLEQHKMKLEEVIANNAGPASKDDFALTDEAGNHVNTDAVISALAGGTRLVLFSLAHKHRWFNEQGAIVLPAEIMCDDGALYAAGTHSVLSAEWATLEEAWDRSRLFRARFKQRDVSVPADSTRVCKELVLGPPDELAKGERIACERLIQLFYQHVVSIMQQPVPPNGLINAGDTPPFSLPPVSYLSAEELASCEILNETFCLPFFDDAISYFGLSLPAWVRGYALLVKRAADVLPGKLWQTTESEFLADLQNHGLSASQARCFLSLVCLQEGSEDLFDTPLIRIINGRLLLFSPALVSPVLWRIVLSRISSLNRSQVAEGNADNSSVFEGKGKAFEQKMLSLCKDAGLKAHGFAYSLAGVDYDCDLSVLIDDVLFVFECKNYALAFNHVPSLYYFGKHLRVFADQVRRIASDLNDHPEIVRLHFGADATWKQVVPVVLQAMPWSQGVVDGVFYYDASALRKLLEDGAVRVVVSARVGNATILRRHCYPTRKGPTPNASELLAELHAPAQQRLYKTGWQIKTVTVPISDSMVLTIPEWQYTPPSLEAKLIALGSSAREAASVAKDLMGDFPAKIDQVRTKWKSRVTKTGRNAPCPCGSGKKYKKCCAS